MLEEYKYYILAIAVFCAFTIGYYKGYDSEHTKYLAYQAEVKAIAEQQVAKNKEIEDNAKKVTEDVKKEYKTNSSKLSAYYANRMSNNGACSMSKVPTSTTGTDEQTQINQPDTTGIDTVSNCAQDVLQLLTLQKWIEEQSK